VEYDVTGTLTFLFQTTQGAYNAVLFNLQRVYSDTKTTIEYFLIYFITDDV